MTALAPARVGWCPGALRPMESGDGLILRVKPRGGVLAFETAMRVADLALRHGNGQLELTGRANLQIRGVRPDAAPRLIEGLRDLQLLDASAEAEAVRNILASPLAGLDRRAPVDIRPLVASLEDRLATDARLWRLPAKWSIVIDDGGPFSLRAFSADIRLEAFDRGSLAVGLGRDPARAFCTIERAPAAVALLCRAALDPDPIRMDMLVDRRGAAAVFAAAGLEREAPLPARPPTVAGDVVGWHALADRTVLGLAAPFGSLGATDLLTTLAAAQAAGATALHLTPWRVLLLTGFPLPSGSPARLPTFPAGDGVNGLIADATDPRLSVAACSGMPACRRATTNVRAHAAALAHALPSATTRNTLALHVSGCAKGCANPQAAPWTLVGRDGLYDLVRDGKPDGVPIAQGLTFQEAARRLSRPLNPGLP